DRIRAIHRAVRAAGMISSPDPFPEFELDGGLINGHGVKLMEKTPPRADEKWLRTIHTPEMIERIHHICEIGGGIIDQGDTRVSPDSFDVALYSLGSLLGCCDAVMSGKVDRAFSAARPPGHHDEPDRAMGFCLFANIAIAVK